MINRRSLTADSTQVPPGSHAMRRSDARIEVTERITLRGQDPDRIAFEGWTLNLSRGGLRAILEAGEGEREALRIELGDEYEVNFGGPHAGSPKRARVVWLQEERDGVVVGLEFLALSGLHRVANQ